MVSSPMKKKKLGLLLAILCFSGPALLAQSSDVRAFINKSGSVPNLAVVDFRGSGGAQPVMGTFNGTLYTDLQTSGLFKMVPKSFYPLQNPQRPEDLRPSSAQGMALLDWANSPVNANYLAFGYTAIQNNQLLLYGYVYDVRQQSLQSAQLLGKRYLGTMDEAGARKVAHEFAADIIAQFGGGSLIGSHIFYVSERGGKKQIWQMDYDGTNQKQLTSCTTICTMPAVSPDGTKVAYTSFDKGQPQIRIISTESGRALPFYNQTASLNAQPSFTADGKQIFYSSTAAQGPAQVYAANLDGTNFRRISVSRNIQMEPKVNPKGTGLAVVTGATGHPQIYRMNLEGAGLERLTNGEGEATNPAWHPDGQHLLFAWTRGYATGGFNIFLLDAATREYDQITRDAGRNENPNWAPDGRHIVFSSNRSGTFQIWSMLADGTQLQRLTSAGNNVMPVWGK